MAETACGVCEPVSSYESSLYEGMFYELWAGVKCTSTIKLKWNSEKVTRGEKIKAENIYFKRIFRLNRHFLQWKEKDKLNNKKNLCWSWIKTIPLILLNVY